MRPSDIRLPGAVDLSTLKPPASQPDGGSAAGSSQSGGVILDVTEATFDAEVVTRSMQVPVVIDFWAEWCGPCKQLSPVLEAMAVEDGGRWVLAKIDVDAQPRLSQAFQIQSIPSVMAVIAGQPVPLFQGAVGQAQVRQVIDEVLKVAEANGVTGTVPVDADDGTSGDAAGPDGAEPADPAYAEAREALDRGDLDGALAAFRAILDRSPADPMAVSGAAMCELLLRTKGADEPGARARAAADPADVDATLLVADLDMARGNVEESFAGVVALIGRTAGDDRDRSRQHLVGLFDVLSPEDPRLAAGRRALANALF
jgi:putative thioredoxin